MTYHKNGHFLLSLLVVLILVVPSSAQSNTTQLQPPIRTMPAQSSGIITRAATQEIYFNDFEGTIGPEWSNTLTDTTPVGARRFLGQFGNESANLTLNNLPSHTVVRVSFDLFIIRTWDGNTTGVGPDVWDLSADGVSPSPLHTTFSNWNVYGFKQAYPGEYPGGDYSARTGAAENNTLGYIETGLGSNMDSVYQLDLTIPHSASSTVLRFSASGLQDLSDESWGLDNVRVSVESTVLPFLDLPYDYSGSNFTKESRDTEQGGKVNAYFDHQYPTYCNLPNTGGCSPADTKAVNFYGYDGTRTNPPPPYHVVYNGHDGIDFLIGQGTPVLAAASGTVIFAGGISTVCNNGQTRTANVVKVRHSNNYVTEYWHLSSFAPGIVPNALVSRDTAHPIGYVGNTGCADGPHLHFQVRNTSGTQVDPYGWEPRPDATWYGKTDPWQQYGTDNGGIDAISYRLWLQPQQAIGFTSPTGATVITSTSGEVAVNVPVGVYAELLRLELGEALESALIPGYRTLNTFSLFGFTTNNNAVTTLEAGVTIDAYLPTSKVKQASAMKSAITPTIQIWNTQSSTWQELPTTWDSLTGHASATSSLLGTFAVSVHEYKIYFPAISR